MIDVTSASPRKLSKSAAREPPVAICMRSNSWLSILLSLRITCASWIIHGPPSGCTAPHRTARCRTDAYENGRAGRDESKKSEGEAGGQIGEEVRARYWCIKRAYLRSLFSRMWTPGMRAVHGKEERGRERERVMGREQGDSARRRPHRAAQRYLFILPRRMDIERTRLRAIRT